MGGLGVITQPAVKVFVMPLLHCNHCHHEFEGNKTDLCGWCDSPAHIIQEQTDLEKMLEEKRLDGILRKFRETHRS